MRNASIMVGIAHGVKTFATLGFVKANRFFVLDVTVHNASFSGHYSPQNLGRTETTMMVFIVDYTKLTWRNALHRRLSMHHIATFG